MEHIKEITNYQKFKETIDDYITENLKPENPIIIVCTQLKDNTINYTINSGNIKETIKMLEITIKNLKEYDNMKI